MWSACHEILARFRNEIAPNHGSILCREIARVDWHDRIRSGVFTGATGSGNARGSSAIRHCSWELLERTAGTTRAGKGRRSPHSDSMMRRSPETPAAACCKALRPQAGLPGKGRPCSGVRNALRSQPTRPL